MRNRIRKGTVDESPCLGLSAKTRLERAQQRTHWFYAGLLAVLSSEWKLSSEFFASEFSDGEYQWHWSNEKRHVKKRTECTNARETQRKREQKL